MDQLLTRDLAQWGTAPPDPRSRLANNPTLLFSWWCTIFSAVIILTRLCGRKIRSNVLFREDWIMMIAMIPLFARMAFIHVVLLYGTNNVQTDGYEFSPERLSHHQLGSKLVLAARIFYAMYIWMSKLTVSEFLKRITIRIWRKSYEIILQGIRVFLFVTFFAVVIATLAECHPFSHYWQVIPDPGPRCRQGFAQLLTMGACDIVTDVLLIAFPIPIIIQSGQNWKRKVQLTMLFSLSLILIAVTGTRMPSVIKHLGRQQYRTVWASAEILASTAVSNCVVLGAFLRDKGSKKNKYRAQSTTDSMDRASNTRRPTLGTIQSTDSDEDLFRSLGCRVPEHLQEKREPTVRPAPAALPAHFSPFSQRDMPPLRTEPSETDSIGSETSLHKGAIQLSTFRSAPTHSHSDTPTIFDMGGLLEDNNHPSSYTTRSRSTTLVGPGTSSTITQDFAGGGTPPEISHRGSRSFISDLGGIQPSSSSSGGAGILPSRSPRIIEELHRAPIGILGPTLERHETQQSLQDAGGLLEPEEIDWPFSSRPPTTTLSTATTTSHWRPTLPTFIASGYSTPRRENADPTNRSPDFHDVGGLLADTHVPDASASALQRAAAGVGTAAAAAAPAGQRDTSRRPAAASTANRGRQPDDMELHDVGGLL